MGGRASNTLTTPVFAFVIYAVAVWYAAVRWRRQWGSFAAVGAGTAGLVFIAWLHYQLNRITDGEVYLAVLQVLLYPYTALVMAVGLFLAALPRAPISWAHCPKCKYDLRGLDAPVESCPECGMTEELARFIAGERFAGFPACDSPVNREASASTIRG